MHIILASSSENRRALFERMKIAFDVVHPDFEEVTDPALPPSAQVEVLAQGKAESVYTKFEQEKDVLIMGFDSLISFEGGSVGKPQNETDAFLMLKSFIGKPQAVVTGFCLVGNLDGKPFLHTESESSAVQFRSDITDDDLRAYLEFGDWKGKCGAYSILGTGQFFLTEIDGDFQNIVGVPILKLGHAVHQVTGRSVFETFGVSE